MNEEPTGAHPPRERRVARLGTRRRRSRSEAGPPPSRPAADSARPADSAGAVASAGAPGQGGTGQDRPATAPSRPKRTRRDGNRGAQHEVGNDGPWRELTGSGRSQVSQAAALRARDAYRPTAADLEQAERDVVIQRRNWTPSS